MSTFRIFLLIFITTFSFHTTTLSGQIPSGKDKLKSNTTQVTTKDFFYEYTVESGDTLWEIAKKYKVSENDLKLWNKIANIHKLKPGQVIRIKSSLPIKKKNKNVYEVKPGDTLGKIAKKLKMNINDLKRLNNIKGNIIHPGQKLYYLTEGPSVLSESIGHTSRGSLVNGEQMPPKGPGYYCKSPGETYGTNETIDLLLLVIKQFRKKFPRAPDIVIGDISRQGGGSMKGHVSHASGRDVDLGLFVKGESDVNRFQWATPETLDLPMNFYLLYALYKTKRVDKIFLDARLQAPLYEYALKKKKASKKELDKLFQYPSNNLDAVVRHSMGHKDHIHIRFLCPKEDKKCVNASRKILISKQ